MSKIVGEDRSEVRPHVPRTERHVSSVAQASIAKQRYERAEKELAAVRAELAQRIKENDLLQQQLLDAGKHKDSLLEASKEVRLFLLLWCRE